MLGVVRREVEAQEQKKRKAAFLEQYGRDAYGYAGHLDSLRTTHFARLATDRTSHPFYFILFYLLAKYNK